jgi:hypothetical protein
LVVKLDRIYQFMKKIGYRIEKLEMKNSPFYVFQTIFEFWKDFTYWIIFLLTTILQYQTIVTMIIFIRKIDL